MSIYRTMFAKPAALMLTALFALPLAAQQQGESGQPSELLQQVQQKQAEIQQLNQQLAQIQQQTIEANPGLADKRDDLMDTVDEKMVEAGHDPEASRDKIEELQGQLQSGELSNQESQSVSQELRQEQTSLRQAQGQAMQNEEVQTRIQSLNEELIAAMREQDPKTDELISQLQTAQQEYQQLMQEAMQKHGGGNPGNPGQG
jgi:uncharacterized coiled-coil DUF342 family protein